MSSPINTGLRLEPVKPMYKDETSFTHFFLQCVAKFRQMYIVLYIEDCNVLISVNSSESEISSNWLNRNRCGRA